MTSAPVTVETWKDVAADHTGDEAARVVLARLQDASWLANLGRPSSRDRDVVRVDGWREAFRMHTEAIVRSEYQPDHGTKPSGTLNAPFWLLLRRLDLDETLHRKTADVANRALSELPDRHYAAAKAIGPSIPEEAWPDAAELEDAGAPLYAMSTIGDYIHEYIRLLCIEIYAGDVAEPRCTYFRDQLGWFLAGFLPCGWEGAWPDGRMRVF